MNHLKIIFGSHRLKYIRVALGSMVFSKRKVTMSVWTVDALAYFDYAFSLSCAVSPSGHYSHIRTWEFTSAGSLILATAAPSLPASWENSMLCPCFHHSCNEIAAKRGPKEGDKNARLNTGFGLQIPSPPSVPNPIRFEENDRGGLPLPSKPAPSFLILSCHFGISSQIESCFPNWPVKSFCHAEIISRAKSGNLRQLGNLTAGWNEARNKRQCE